MVLLTVTLLGGFEARLASGATLTLPKKAQGLLAYLGVRSGEGQPRDKLASLLWSEKSAEQARDGLRHALAALRRALGSAQSQVLRVEGQALALEAARVEVDAATFERQLADGAPPALEQAAALYRGDFLLGFTVNEPLFEEWLVGERERLREMALAALARLLAHQSEAASTERAIQTAIRLLGLDPLQETVHRTLMRLYARQGRRGAALKQYQACVAALRRELGTEPEKQTRALYQELLRGDEVRRPPRDVVPAPPDLPAAETPLFGRPAEVERLRRTLDGALGGRGHVVTVVGEAGIGKTRLVATLAAEAVSRGCRVLIGHCHESDSILPFGPWVDACRSGAVSADDEILAAMHPTRRAELARLLPETSRPGLPRAGDTALPLFESVAGLIEQLAARQPLLFVLEDLHWADEMSLRLLAFVGRRVAPWPALLVVTAREEELPDAAMARKTLEELSRGPAATAMVLSPLSRADTARLTRALTRVGRDEATLARLEAQVWSTSDGNPFVAVEVVRELDQPNPETSVRAAPDARALPARVRDLVARRLDRLTARGQELAAVAAVIGRGFEFGLLRAAGDVDEHDAAEAVEEMVRYRILQAVGDELDFTHDRIRDVAYGRLLPHRRQVLHRAVAEALERTGAEGEAIEQIAHHALRGELREPAVRYLRQAGTRAAARSALHDAQAWFAQALGVLDTLPENRVTLEEAFEIRLGLRPVLVQLGETRLTLQRLREAETLAERLNDDHRRGRVCAFMTNIHALLGDPGAGIEDGQRALEIAGRLGDCRLRILATTYLEQAHYYRGEYARVVELAEKNLAALPADWVYEFFGGSQPPSVNDRRWLALSLAHLGRFAEAAEHAAEAIRLAVPTHHPYTMSVAYEAAGVLYALKGDWAKAARAAECEVAALRAGTIVDTLPKALAYFARILAYLGDGAGALSLVRESEQLLEGLVAGGRFWNYGYLALAHTCLRLGRLDEARRLADRALDVPSRVEFVPNALHLLGDLAIHPDGFDAERGEACYREALALAEARGMRPLVAHCHLGLGRLRQRTGSSPRAREHLATATAAYRELGMEYWLAEAEAVALES